MKNELSIPSCETAITINDGGNELEYTELYLTRFVYNNPKTVNLILDHQGKSDGWDNPENTDQPVRIEIGLRSIDSEFKNALQKAYEKRHRLSLNIVDTSNGSTVSGRMMVINSSPRNRTIEGGAANRYDTNLVLLVAQKNWNEDYK
ncbi:hypothetical protein ACWO80_003439 [Vibrio cholerae]